MDIGVFGSGYVGLVQAAVMADVGHNVTCMDIDSQRVATLTTADVPFYEPGLARMLGEALDNKLLSFTDDAAATIDACDYLFIAVGTPAGEDGSADLQYVLNVAGSIGAGMTTRKLVIIKSTVPVGTADLVRETIQAELDQRDADIPFDVVSNPEFLKEGSAVADATRPDRIIIGSNSAQAIDEMRIMYQAYNRNRDKLMAMDSRSAEMTKYAANAMLATRISFMNQVAALCEAAGADVNMVRRGVGSDPRIGASFLYAGAGYGGSCFPKDVRALIQTGEERSVDLSILKEVHETNERQKKVLGRKIRTRFGEDLSGMSFAVWGLAFKPETDDMREAASVTLIEELLAAGATVTAHDPVAEEVSREWYLGDRIGYAPDEYAALSGANALVVVTEWLQYRRPNWERVKEELGSPIVFDGRNLYDPARMRRHGLEYYSIGREQVR